MENTEIASNENELKNQNEISNNVENPEISNDNSQKPPIVDEIKKEVLTNDSTTNGNLESEKSETVPTEIPKSPKSPELSSRKSSKNLSKEEKLRRQRELRKKKILASSQERLSRITKTYSQSSFHDSDKDGSSLSRKSSSRSIHHHHNIDRVSSSNSINKDTNTNALTAEPDNSLVTTEQQNSNINNISRNTSLNSLNSLENNNETINITNANLNSEPVESIPRNDEKLEDENTNNSSINDSKSDFSSSSSKMDANKSNEFARMLFREMLKEEYNKTNNPYGQSANATPFGNLNSPHDIKSGMDTLLTADKPFEALGKMFDFLNGDEQISEEQKISEEKYNKYCKICKLVHTILIFLYSLLVVFVSVKAVNLVNNNYDYGTKSSFGNFLYRLSNCDSLSQGKTILGMTPWTFLVLLEITLLSGQMGYQYVFNIKKETFKEFDLIPIPIVNKAISLLNQYKLYIEVLVNDLFLYLFIIGFSVSIGKIFY